MTVTIASTTSGGLYPPTVQGSPGLLPLHKYLFRFVRNPLSSLPQAAYEERIIVYNNGRAVIVWVCDPALIESARRNWPFLRDRRVDAYGPILRRYLGDRR